MSSIIVFIWPYEDAIHLSKARRHVSHACAAEWYLSGFTLALLPPKLCKTLASPLSTRLVSYLLQKYSIVYATDTYTHKDT